MKSKDEKKTEQIFTAALQLVKEKGVAGITMREIAQAANIATGTLYIYFKNKEDLINALFTDCRRTAVNMYFMNYDKALPFKTGFKTVWLNLLKFRARHFDEAIFMDQCNHSPFITNTTKQITKEMIQPLYKLVERGKDEKILKNIDSIIQLTFMVGSIHQFVNNCIYSDKKMTKAMIEQLFDLCWDGLKA